MNIWHRLAAYIYKKMAPRVVCLLYLFAVLTETVQELTRSASASLCDDLITGASSIERDAP